MLHMGEVRYEVAAFLLSLFDERRYEMTIRMCSAKPQMNNRNQIAKRFLEGDADVLFMLDDDQIVTTDPLRLLERDLDVVGLPTPIYKRDRGPGNEVAWNVWLYTDKGPLWEEARFPGNSDGSEDHLVECAAVGTGAIMIARRVLEHPAMRAPFRDLYDEDGIRTWGYDLVFCHRAREAGFRVWAAMSHPCGHSYDVNLLEFLSPREEKP